MNVHDIFKGLSLTGFLEEIDRLRASWIVKRLSGNDTGLTGGHQSGIYFPRVFSQRVFPEIYTTKQHNPCFFMKGCFFPDVDLLTKNLRAVYYNSKYFPEKGNKKKYDEFRITRWGGSSPVQDVENTGSICVFAVLREGGDVWPVAWIASNLEEENIVESWLGREVDPEFFCMDKQEDSEESLLMPLEIPKEWFDTFPSGRDIFSFVCRCLPHEKRNASLDRLLLKRRALEFKIFERIEKKDVFPKISKGFLSVESFVRYAHSVSNRRKSRSGTSLELNLEAIFSREKLCFEVQSVTENRKKPDFLFPSGKAYHDKNYPEKKLHMLASKTCCKDRWRQVLNEADRISTKHLFTLQNGVSSSQLQEMVDNRVQLVVPDDFIKSFPPEWRKSLFSLEKFVGFIRSNQEAIFSGT